MNDGHNPNDHTLNLIHGAGIADEELIQGVEIPVQVPLSSPKLTNLYRRPSVST